MKRLQHSAYTVGWICALSVEMAAAKAMLDEEHENLPQPQRDSNSYALGEIFGHNVVIACLPSGEYGTSSAATVSTQMLSTFEGIQFNLMVGIGGGVPTMKDIRLGDVVVSHGVVQYDYGKAIEHGQFICTGRLNRPPAKLLTAASALRSDHLMGMNRTYQFVLEMVKKYPAMSQFLLPRSAPDYLFRSDYNHQKNEISCASCDKSMLVLRGTRYSQTPVIYYGLIASGNQVMRDAPTRDRLAREHGVICFEMEAAGLMNHSPCLVIRGICDYSDSHKTKEWQCYAAGTAAAYTKELLAVLGCSEGGGERLTHSARYPPEWDSIWCQWEGCERKDPFRRQGDLHRHIRTTHISPRAFECNICGRPFNRSDKLAAHMRGLHPF